MSPSSAALMKMVHSLPLSKPNLDTVYVTILDGRRQIATFFFTHFPSVFKAFNDFKIISRMV